MLAAGCFVCAIGCCIHRSCCIVRACKIRRMTCVLYDSSCSTWELELAALRMLESGPSCRMG
eukprot:5952726-Amphidinium_carterae.2